ncbi:hypothetical protein QBC35DRAFT_548009 [Podospora australis]|uniref:Uncharacterized protein n=1 Tax=Podospora australis TaxID=1536484 RepID=A0AAN7AHM5_9PEZI|nr:hypothetical protein QBC35DRAFT_548009 [Podospora australis]
MPLLRPTPRLLAARITKVKVPPGTPRTPPPKWKAMLWTGVFAAVTITGTIYGAGLKTQQEWQSEKKKRQEATLEEQTNLLNTQLKKLQKEKAEIEDKLAYVRERAERRRERDGQ